jgi:hypothetical protein
MLAIRYLPTRTCADECSVPASTGGDGTIGSLVDEAISRLADALAEDIQNSPDHELLYDATYDQGQLAAEARCIFERAVIDAGGPSAAIIPWPVSPKRVIPQSLEIVPSPVAAPRPVERTNIRLILGVLCVSVALLATAYMLIPVAPETIKLQPVDFQRSFHSMRSETILSFSGPPSAPFFDRRLLSSLPLAASVGDERALADETTGSIVPLLPKGAPRSTSSRRTLP